MTRLTYPTAGEAPPAAQALFAEIRKTMGKVPNAYVAIGGLSPAALHLRYRLRGLDADRVDAGSRREASCVNLGPGHHVFEVEATNEHGGRSRAPATLPFDIPPTLTQSWLFRTLCGLTLLGGVALLVRWRLRLAVERERMRNEVRLRERIARELHDTLPQGTQGFVWNVQGAANQLDEGRPVRSLMEQALAGADRVMVEGRDRILQLRTLGVEADDLPEALEQLGHALSRGSPTRCVLKIDGEPRPLRAQVVDELYQIARAAMGNAYRHAQAATVEVLLSDGPAQFRLRVKDDGIGYTVAADGGRSPPGRWGLTGMQERAEALAAGMALRSQPGVGTEGALPLPACAAYA